MEKSTQMGHNRTGTDVSPVHSKQMISGSEQYAPRSGSGPSQSLAAMEGQYVNGSSVGSVPMPGTFKGAMKSMMEKATGANPEVLINKLGERLAYERSGTRLYESFIRKCEALGEGAIAPISLAKLREIRNEEEKHFLLLKQCMEDMGADPTAETPDADISGVAASGLMKVVMDPRTSPSQCLECLLSVELTDNAAWEVLISLADGLGMDQMVSDFQGALDEEKDHENTVRQWYKESLTVQSVKH